MGIKISLLAVMILIFGVFLGIEVLKLHYFFGIVVPCLALAIFLMGIVYRIIMWGRTPVPFRIPTTCGQQKSLSWIKQDKLDNPAATAGVVGRMLLEVLFFRSLFRNTKAEMTEDARIVYQWEKWLWLAALIFHWSFLIIVLRHLRFFTDPVPGLIYYLEKTDGFFLINLESLYLTGAALLIAVTYLFVRRVAIPQVRYISLPADYFPLIIIFGIASTGMLMRYVFREDVAAVKEMMMGLVAFSPAVPEGVGALFFIHLFLVCLLFAYFPFSKLLHMGGIFLSPTRNLPNDSRQARHLNPWNYPVKVHAYEAYEEEFRAKMKAAGLPVEKETGEKEVV